LHLSLSFDRVTPSQLYFTSSEEFKKRIEEKENFKIETYLNEIN
jgi:hypothetical protein